MIIWSTTMIDLEKSQPRAWVQDKVCLHMKAWIYKKLGFLDMLNALARPSLYVQSLFEVSWDEVPYWLGSMEHDGAEVKSRSSCIM
jgi:hypothetical protein